MLPVSEADLAAGDPAAAVEIVMAHLWKRYGEGVPPAGSRWMADRELPAEFDDGFTVGFASESAENWQVTVTYVLDTTGKALMRVSVSSEITVFRWEGEVDVSGEVSELVAPPGPQAAACWYGRIREMPADSSYDDCLVLPPEGAGAPMIGLVGADQGIENEIADLRTSGAYGHFFGTLEWDPTDCGGYRLVVSGLWPEGSGEETSGPDPVQAWTGVVRGTTAAAQFDDYFFLSPYPVRFGLEGADPAVGAQLAALRDSGAVVQLWGEVTCPAVDYYGAQITVRRIETVMDAPIRPEGYEGWLAYQNATHTYTLWHPEDWTMLGTNLDESVTFQGPLIDDEVWPVVTISHPNTPLYRPPPGMDLQAWYEAKGVHYDSPAVLAGLPALRTSHPGGAGSYGSDQFALIRGEQLLTVGFLHTGGREDWALYDKLLTSFSFPQ